MRAHTAAFECSSIYKAARWYLQIPFLIELWHSLFLVSTSGGNAVTWTGLLRSLILSAPSVPTRPPYAADSTFFPGKSVIQCDTANSRRLQNLSMGVLAPAGTKPCLLVVGRLRATSSSECIIVDCAKNAASDDQLVFMTRHIGSQNLYEGYLNNRAGFADQAAPIDTSPWAVAAWPDGANMNINKNGTLVQSAYAGSLASDVTQIVVNSNSLNRFTDVSIGLVALLSQYPGDAAIADFVRLARSGPEFAF